MPDLLVLCWDVLHLVEVKTEHHPRMTPAEMAFARRLGGVVDVVHSVDEAVALVKRWRQQ